MKNSDASSGSLSTSTTLLGRIINPDDNDSWQQFLRKYRRVLFALAMKKGLTDDEAGDAVQETLIAVANNISKFTQGSPRSFRPWLFKIANSKTVDQLRKRLPVQKRAERTAAGSERTDIIERIPNPTSLGFEARWERQERQHIQEAALKKLRATVKAQHYQIYDAYAVKGWEINKVVAAFGVTPDNVHKVHERLKRKLQQEIIRLGGSADSRGATLTK